MTSILVLLALELPATAFAPDDTVYQGIEPHRVHVVHPAVQAQFLTSEPWRAFVESDGTGWRAVFDEVTGAPGQLWGAGIDLGPADSSAAVGAGLIALLDRHAPLFGFEQSTLTLRSAKYSASTSTWYVDVALRPGGIPVYRGGISGRIKHGRLISLSVATTPGAPITGSLDLGARAASQAAIARGPAPDAIHDDVAVEPRLLVVEADQLELRKTWMVTSTTASPPGRWVSFVDGESGALLSVHNEVRFLQGQVHGEHHERTVDGSDPVVSPMPLVEVAGDSGVALAGEDGVFELDDSELYITDLQGDYVQVTNVDGPNGVLASPDPVMTWTTENATPAEINSYVFLHHVREWGRRVAPDVDMVNQRLRSNVNVQSGTCNAYWDGNVNFYDAGGGCNNTGEIADVNYHEWGHGFHYFSIEGGYFGFDGSLSEGASDTVAFFLTGDNIIAPYFGVEGWGIRDVDNDRRYPEDYSNQGNSVHTNGLIFGGSMWDLWHILMDEEGVEQGTASAEHIFSGLLKAGPDVASSYDEAMVADDDDGDLSNGTPHGCEIMEAFGQHGLGPLGTGVLYMTAHTPLSEVPAGDPHAVAAELIPVAPTCFPGDPVAASVHFRVNGQGGWDSAELTVAGFAVEGAIPTQQPGDFVEYYLTIEDASGAEIHAPTGARINPFSFYVGDTLAVYCDDFEGQDGGFTHKLVEGEEGDGADDWQWGRPRGRSGDPESAHSGNKVWGNDLGRDGFDGAYQGEKHNRLRSPTIELGHYQGAFLHYWRWLGVEDGIFDRASIEVDNTVVWSNRASKEEEGAEDDHVDDQWSPHAVPLPVDDDGVIRVSFELVTDRGVNFGGWNVDDFCILAPATPDNRLGVADFAASRTENGGAALAWTNPVHEPVESVIVIRNGAHLPTAPTDGVVVYSSADVAPGELVEVVDDLAFGGAAWYAVYPGDGADRLSWTVEGLNAAFVDGQGVAGSVAPAATVSGQGCGCASSAPGGLGGLVLPMLLLLSRRRRA